MSIGLLHPIEILHTNVNKKKSRSQYVQSRLTNRTRQAFARFATTAEHREEKLVHVKDLSNGLTPYEEAWRLQKTLMADLLPGGEAHELVAGYLLLVQHPPVYTLGSGSSLDHLGFDPASPPHPLFRTERGGEVTYHGPGQLVVYPIINLRRFQPDLHWYLRSLEEVIIRVLCEVSGLTGERIPGLTGVWVDGQKVAAIGVRANKWVTYHGLAINITTDLAPFLHITPCGISDRSVTSVQDLLGKHPHGSSRPNASGVPDQQQQEARISTEAALLLREYTFAIMSAFADVFGARLQEDHAHVVDSTSSEAAASALSSACR